MRLPLLLVSALAFTTLLGGCEAAPKPDYRIKLMSAPNGKGVVAVPPECPSWTDVASGPLENQPWPQYGCAQARNLAAQIERPEDLIQGRPSDRIDAEVNAAAVDRYRLGRTKQLIDAKAEAPIAIMTPQGSGSK